jgi:hypothetical protein
MTPSLRSVLTTPQTVPTVNPMNNKRKPESSDDQRPKKRAAIEYNLSSLFKAILDTIDRKHPQFASTIYDAVDMLCDKDDYLFILHQVSLKKVKEQFNRFVNANGIQNDQKWWALKILNNLYPVSLENSSSYETLQQTAKDLPELQMKLKNNLSKEWHTLLREARGLKRQAKGCVTIEEIGLILPQIDKLLKTLNEFRGWKQYQDRDENKHILDLANFYKRVNTPQQYPGILKEYKPFVKQLHTLRGELTSISAMVTQLHDLKLQLLKQRSALAHVDVKEDPLESRFLNAYGNEFYNAFSEHFSGLLWNSKEDPEISSLLQKIPNWDGTNRATVSFAFLNSIWGIYLPDCAFQDWILKALSSINLSDLDTLEKKLQALSKSVNEIHENPLMTKEDKRMREEPLKKEMQTHCCVATRSAFSTLMELKTYLTA